MQKYLFALILVGMFVSDSLTATAQTTQTIPEITQENLTTSSSQAENLRNLIDSANDKVKKGEYQAARLDLNKAIEISPQNAPLFALRGIVYTGLERHERAIQEYNQAIQIDPKNITFYNLRGEAYTRAQLYQLAVANYSQVLQLDPKSSQAYIKRGWAYRALRDGDKSIADFNQAVTINPQDPEVYNGRGNFYADIFKNSTPRTEEFLPVFSNYIGNTDRQAFDNYDMAVKLNPKIAVHYYNRGLLHIEIIKRGGSSSSKNWAIDDLKIAAKLFLEAGDEKNYNIVIQTIDRLR